MDFSFAVFDPPYRSRSTVIRLMTEDGGVYHNSGDDCIFGKKPQIQVTKHLILLCYVLEYEASKWKQNNFINNHLDCAKPLLLRTLSRNPKSNINTLIC